MKIFQRAVVLLSVFSPFLLLGYLFTAIGPGSLDLLRMFGGIDWMWMILLALMMVGVYYFLAVYLVEEDEIERDFRGLDRDHDGFLVREDAKGWVRLARDFDHFDSDHDGRLSRGDFERFEHALAR